DVRHAAGYDAERVARRERCDDARRILTQTLGVVAFADADEHTGRAVEQRGGRLAGVFERFPRHPEEETLLRIHADRFALLDTEERGVEVLHVAHEPAPAAG